MVGDGLNGLSARKLLLLPTNCLVANHCFDFGGGDGRSTRVRWNSLARGVEGSAKKKMILDCREFNGFECNSGVGG